MRARTWICPRQIGGLRCGGINAPRSRKCHTCGKPRPPRRRPKHLVALETPYEEYIVLNGGDRCAICLRERTEKDRRFDRDHDHRTGRPRGLLCHKCNRALPSWITPEWLRAAADYLDRVAA
jgi:hypothetical protein